MITRTLAVLFLASACLCPAAPAPSPADTLDAAALAREVREEFLHAWRSYKHHAWGHDAPRPHSKTAYDWYGPSLYMSAVDALDTMILMGLQEEAEVRPSASADARWPPRSSR